MKNLIARSDEEITDVEEIKNRLITEEERFVDIEVISRENGLMDTFNGEIIHDYNYPYTMYKGSSSCVYKNCGHYYIYPQG